MLCVSMESVDQVGRRERFMQSNFESLSGGDEGSLSTTNNSISNAWREGGSSAHQRNAGTIDAARRLRDAEQNRRREELQRRIEETSTKLQNIGYRTLKGSQSINDLSNFPDGSVANTSGGPSGGSGGTLPRSSRAEDEGASSKAREEESSSSPKTEEGKAESGGSSLRRACSLSDLNKPSVPRRILPAPPANVSGKKGGGGGVGGPLMSSTPTRPASLTSEAERFSRRERRKSVDERSDRGSDYGGRKG